MSKRPFSFLRLMSNLIYHIANARINNNITNPNKSWVVFSNGKIMSQEEYDALSNGKTIFATFIESSEDGSEGKKTQFSISSDKNRIWIDVLSCQNYKTEDLFDSSIS